MESWRSLDYSLVSIHTPYGDRDAVIRLWGCGEEGASGMTSCSSNNRGVRHFPTKLGWARPLVADNRAVGLPTSDVHDSVQAVHWSIYLVYSLWSRDLSLST